MLFMEGGRGQNKDTKAYLWTVACARMLHGMQHQLSRSHLGWERLCKALPVSRGTLLGLAAAHCNFCSFSARHVPSWAGLPKFSLSSRCLAAEKGRDGYGARVKTALLATYCTCTVPCCA